jgi:hypothetical protein
MNSKFRFADQIHPTAVSNAFIANKVIYLMNTKWKDYIPSYTNRQVTKLAHIPYDTVGLFREVSTQGLHEGM